MAISQPVLFSTLALLVAIPIAIWISRRTSAALHRHDAALDQIDFDRVTAAVPELDRTDTLGQIDFLIQEEVTLIREILDERASGAQVTPEHLQELRQIHRHGLALRQCCGDVALDAEIGWLQTYGSLALMSDLAELDRVTFERELAFRADEVHRAVRLRRGQPGSSDSESGNGASVSSGRQLRSGA